MNDARDDSPARWTDAALIVIVALVVRLIAHAQMAEAPHTFAPVIDSEAYTIQALRVAGGHDIVDGVYFQAPLYPWVLGAVFAACGHEGVPPGAETIADIPADALASALTIGRRFQLVLGVILVVLVWKLAATLFGRRVALAAGLIGALYGPFMFYEAHLMKVTLALVFWPAAVLAGIWAVRGMSARRFMLVGLLLGASALVRGNSQIVSAVGLSVLLVISARRAQLAWGLCASGWWVAGILLAMAPVFVRNSIVVGSPVVSTATPGTAFYLCNHKGNAVGMIEHIAINRQVPRYEQQDWQREAETRLGRELSPGEVSSYWLAQAFDEILEDPGRYALAQIRKTAMLFSRYEAPDNSQYVLGEEASAVLRWTPMRHATLVPLALAGLVVSWRRRKKGARPGEVALVVAIVGYVLSLLAFTAVSRFRVPLVPLLLPYAGLGLIEVVRVGSQWRAALAAGVVGLGLIFVSELPWPGPLSTKEKARHLSVRLLNRGQVAFAMGDTAAGVADLERAIAESEAAGTRAPAIYATLAGHKRALAAQAAGRGDEATAGALRSEAEELLVAKALAISPDHGPANRELGLLYYEAGFDDDAVTSLTRAVRAVPGDRVARVYLSLALLVTNRPVDAEEHARTLVREWPQHDDSHGILALALAAQGRTAEATVAVARYDELAAQREAGGSLRRLGDQPVFAPLRAP